MSLNKQNIRIITNILSNDLLKRNDDIEKIMQRNNDDLLENQTYESDGRFEQTQCSIRKRICV
jgi:hypothetical protein